MSVRRITIALAEGLGPETLGHLVGDDSPVTVVSIVAASAVNAVAIDDRRIDAVLCVSPGADVDTMAFVTAMTEQHPWLPIVVACSPLASVREILAAGASDVVALLDREQGIDATTAQYVAFTLEKVMAQRGTAGNGDSRGDVITVLGPKGGTGKTLTTCNLAVTLAQAGKQVTIVDLDLQFGDVGLSLGLDPVHTIHDLAAAGGTIDADKLEAYLTPHSSGVRTLLAPVRPDQADIVTPDFVREVLAALRLISDVVIVDTPPGFTPAVIASIDSSTSMCLVSMLDSLSLKNTRVALDTLELMGYGDDSLQLVLNRADSDVGVQARDVEALLGRRPDILIPSSRTITRAVNEGTPIVATDPSSEAARAFGALAQTYGGAAPRRPRQRPTTPAAGVADSRRRCVRCERR